MKLPEAIQLPIFYKISEIAQENNVQVFVVGGYVRDFLMKRPFKADIDFVVEGDGISLAMELSKRLKGEPEVSIFKRYGTAMLKYQGWQLEFVGARKESYTPDSRNPSVEKGTIEDDQKRRDFTINAMAISLNTNTYGMFIDPFSGEQDISAKIIKTSQDPSITYSDDPLRMLRAIRFANQLDFQIEENSFQTIQDNVSRIKILSSERITEELNKIMMTSKPSVGFILLEKSGILKQIIPELVDLKGIEEKDGHKHKDNFYHTLEVLDNIANVTDNLWLRWAALLHDIGKSKTKRFEEKTGWTFHMHEYVGSKMVPKIFYRLKLPLGQTLKYVQKIIKLSSRPIALISEQVSDSAIRRLLFESGDDFEDLMMLCKADITTKNPNKQKQYHANFKLVEQKALELEEKDRIRNFKSPIDGEFIMQKFHIKPGKEVGEIKNQIKEAILEGEIENEFNQAYAYMLTLGEKLRLKKI